MVFQAIILISAKLGKPFADVAFLLLQLTLQYERFRVTVLDLYYRDLVFSTVIRIQNSSNFTGTKLSHIDFMFSILIVKYVYIVLI